MAIEKRSNVVPAGTNQVLNFGWPLLEGERCLVACDTPGLIAPVLIAASLLANTSWLSVPNQTAGGLGIPINCEAKGIPTTSYCGRPARAGDVMQLYVTGLGEATSTGAPGGPRLPLNSAAPATPLYYAVEVPQIKVGGIQATVLSAGRAPGFAGLGQVNFEIPPNAPVGDEIPVTITDSSGRTDMKLIAIQAP